MKINRHNYEEFFLLYIDGELCAADGKVVEDFVLANPDLLEELKLLKQTIIGASDKEKMPRKNLYKETTVAVEWQERLLLFIDGELPANEHPLLQEKISGDASVKKEYELLAKTKQPANEKIKFDNKEILYRKENGKIATGRFVRWAVAAALLAFGLFYGIGFLVKKQPATPAFVKDIKSNINSNSTIVTVPQNKKSTNQLPAIVADSGNKYDSNSGKTPDEKRLAVKENKNEKNIVTNTNNAALNKQMQRYKNLTVTEKQTKADLPELITEAPKEQVAALAPEKKTNAPAVSDINMVPLENGYGLASSLTEAFEKSDNKILYMDEDALRRSKTGGFFKKIKRIIERTAKIKTGNSIKIAGFEFASN